MFEDPRNKIAGLNARNDNMSVEFILGRSGTGKTRYCVAGVVEGLCREGDGRGIILLVPEQATYQAERAILGGGEISGYHRLSVLSFSRLEYMLLGSRTAMGSVSRIGRAMIVQRILREKRDQLALLGASAERSGLGWEIAEVIGEIYRYGYGAEDLERVSGELEAGSKKLEVGSENGSSVAGQVSSTLGQGSGIAGLKFGEIALVVEEYRQRIEGRRVDPDIQLKEACEKVAKAEWLAGAEVWVDGFSGFTGSESAMLTELMKVASASHIALCLEPARMDLRGTRREQGDVSIFSPTERTYYDIFDRAKKCKLKIRRPVVLTGAKRFDGSGELAHIEREIFSGSQKKAVCGGAAGVAKTEVRSQKSEVRSQESGVRKAGGGDRLEVRSKKLEVGSGDVENVRIVCAANARGEVQFVARQILELVRERGYRYRDIAVVASDIGSYEHYVIACFEDYGIPFFIDKCKVLSRHPVVELICSALSVVTEGFSSSDVFAYLKTDLAGVEREMGDLLENYCVAFGVRGADWVREKGWEFAGGDDARFDEAKVNEIKGRVRGPLVKLAERLGAGEGEGICAREFTEGVFEFLDELGVSGTLAGWIEQASDGGDIGARQGKGGQAADEHGQFWERFVDVFDELSEAFEECKLVCEDYLSILKSAFSEMTMAFIPPTLDQVLVGSIERSRHPDLKAVFLLGATQKEFPVPIESVGILGDEDRALAERAGMELGSSRRESMVERQYLAYIAFTRASEYLCVTYPAVNEKGGGVVRSQFVDSLEGLFENLQAESIGAEEICVERIYSASELEDMLCCGLGRDAEAQTGAHGELLAAMCGDAELGELARRVTSAIGYENRAELGAEVVGGLFGKCLRSSASRLGTFARCPYQYFSRYVLDLKERAEFKLEPLDVGDFYHRVLDAVVKRLVAEKKDIAAVEEGRLVQLVREVTGQVMESDSFMVNFGRHGGHNAFVLNCACENVERCVTAVAEMIRAGVFRPVRSEVGFGTIAGQRGELGDLRIELGEGRELNLRGKIDRVDAAQTDEGKLAVVFDYKRSGKSFSWDGLLYGLDLQLVVYLLALSDSQNGRQIGGRPVGAFFVPVESRPGRPWYAKGIFNGEFWEQLDKGCSRWSRYYNFDVTAKDGQYGNYGKSGALRGGDFEKVIEFGKGKVVELAEGIVSGGIDVRPYRLRGKSACGWCKYKSVCRFDWQVNEYRYLEGMGKTEVLGRIGDGKKD